MARNTQRIIALTGAIVFFVSTVAFSGLVIWQLYQDSQGDDSLATELDTSDMEAPDDGITGEPLPNFEPVASVDELEIIDTQEGDGREAKEGDTVVVHYTGATAADGLIFESSLSGGEPVTFPLEGLIPGWQEGLPGMKAGGSRRLVIPAEKAYGENPPPGSRIPANAALVFDIDLIEVRDSE